MVARSNLKDVEQTGAIQLEGRRTPGPTGLGRARRCFFKDQSGNNVYVNAPTAAEPSTRTPPGSPFAPTRCARVAPPRRPNLSRLSASGRRLFGGGVASAPQLSELVDDAASVARSLPPRRRSQSEDDASAADARSLPPVRHRKTQSVVVVSPRRRATSG